VLSKKRRFFRQAVALVKKLDNAVKGRKNAALAAFYKALSTENVDKGFEAIGRKVALRLKPPNMPTQHPSIEGFINRANNMP
jgi:hypothetical protein